VRLIRLKTFKKYFSLEPFDRVFRGADTSASQIDPICLVGVNGSGKSNLIELLSSIFCYLERLTIGYKSLPSSQARFDIPFEIEYDLSLPRKRSQRILIAQPPDSKVPVFKDISGTAPVDIRGPHEQFAVLPPRVFGFTSGLNETVSFPYLKNQSFYSEEVRERAQAEEKGVKFTEDVRGTKTMLLNYDINAAVVLSNYLFQPTAEVRAFSERLHISGVHSFRIDVNWKPLSGKSVVKRTREIDRTVSKLRACAFMYRRHSENHVTFEYCVNAATRQAFKAHFRDGAEFLTSIYKLSLLNALSLSKEDREFYRSEENKSGLVERPPEVSAEQKVFRISRLKLVLSASGIPIDYSAISDGEHQFLLVVGAALLFQDRNALFLLDEPETHHNPDWRRKFISTLNSIAEGHDQEFVISTHAPFVVSDCHGRSVFKFDRQGDRAIWNPIGFETYGASFDRILTDLFGLTTLISEGAMLDLESAVRSTSKRNVRAAIERLGDSYEKRHLYEHAARLFGKKAKK